jgi:hypothetical protein
MGKRTPTAPEFSRPVEVERAGASGIDLDIEAGVQERQALARRFGLVSLDRLVARARFVVLRAGFVRVEGRYEADVVQACVVSLEPVAACLAESFSIAFDAEARDEAGEIDLAPGAAEPPEPLRDGVVDIGEAVVQLMAVALDPYPRAPGASLAAGVERAEEDGPFAALAALRKH